jgi:hypothetical protein
LSGLFHNKILFSPAAKRKVKVFNSALNMSKSCSWSQGIYHMGWMFLCKWTPC